MKVENNEITEINFSPEKERKNFRAILNANLNFKDLIMIIVFYSNILKLSFIFSSLVFASCLP